MNIAKLSRQIAMESSTIADVANGRGYHAEVVDYYKQAFELEKSGAPDLR